MLNDKNINKMQDQVTQGTMKVNQLFILESKVTMLIIATTFLKN